MSPPGVVMIQHCMVETGEFLQASWHVHGTCLPNPAEFKSGQEEERTFLLGC